ncbi:hypothetical protein [Lacrimispora sp.]|nr:hypothetical protein [Lacrimispora sp.]
MSISKYFREDGKQNDYGSLPMLFAKDGVVFSLTPAERPDFGVAL